jgi:hypothetical protein
VIVTTSQRHVLKGRHDTERGVAVRRQPADLPTLNISMLTCAFAAPDKLTQAG